MWKHKASLVQRILCVVLAGFAMWPHGVTSTSLVILLVLTLFTTSLKTVPWQSVLWVNLPVMLLLMAWLMHGYSSNGWSEIQLSGSWIALSMVMLSASNRSNFGIAFIGWSMVQSLVVLAALAMAPPLPQAAFAYHLRTYLGETFSIHPTLLAGCWSVAGMMLLTHHKGAPVVKYAGTLWLLLMTALLGAKMAFLALALIGSAWVVFQARPTHRWYVLMASVILVIGLSSTPVIWERMERMVQVDTDFKPGQDLTSSEIRYGVWNCSGQIFMEHPFTGVGVGHTRQALEQCYDQFQQEEFYWGEFNSHNQYLHFLLAGGLVAALLFVSFWLVNGWHYMRHKHWRQLAITLFLMMLMLTENYLSRQVGITLIASAALIQFWSSRSSPLSSDS